MAAFIQRNLELHFKIGFKICILKICEFYLYSKYFGNQNISQNSRNSGEFLWYIIFWKSFFQTWSNFKKTTAITKIGKY